MNFIKYFLPVIFLTIFLTGCGQDTEREMPDTENSEMEENTAVAVLSPTEGNNVRGEVTFTRVDDGIKIVADIQGLPPGEHGFHVHENGDCSAPDASSAGGHFAPLGHPHGAPTDPDSARHVGDMGNIEAGNDSTVHFEWTSNLMSFEGETSIIGKAVIVHEKADDFKSQPSGNAGSRLACGVIEFENTQNQNQNMQMDTTGTGM